MTNIGTFVVSIDAGTSSVRSLLFDKLGNQVEGCGDQLTYDITTTPDGGVEVDPDTLFDLTIRTLTTLHRQLQASGHKPAAVGMSAFWHSFLGVDQTGHPTTPILHLFDTRSTGAVTELKAKFDEARVHARTGCPIHTSYWPAKLLWLHSARPEQFAATARWMSFGEYLFLRLFGAPALSVSMASGSGIWNQRDNCYDPEMLAALPVRTEQLFPVEQMDQPAQGLLPPYRAEWPLFDGIPWFPAYGDGACNNAGSGCVSRDTFSLMVGTSGAMRAVVGDARVETSAGLWCYRVDRQRYLLGGALSNGGEVYAWMKRNLNLGNEAALEGALASRQPGSHGLVVLPFFAGERSPYWRADLRAAITGLNLATQPIDMLQAALESVALRFAEIYRLMCDSTGAPARVIASGGALLHSPAWTQMMADSLGAPVVASVEHEASSRGAALLVLERLGVLGNIAGAPVRTGKMFEPRPGNHAIYQRLLGEQQRLYSKLFVEN